MDKDQVIFDLINTRMDRLEVKVDRLVGFRWMLIGGALTISSIISLVVSVYFGR